MSPLEEAYYKSQIAAGVATVFSAFLGLLMIFIAWVAHTHSKETLRLARLANLREECRFREEFPDNTEYAEKKNEMEEAAAAPSRLAAALSCLWSALCRLWSALAAVCRRLWPILRSVWGWLVTCFRLATTTRPSTAARRAVGGVAVGGVPLQRRRRGAPAGRGPPSAASAASGRSSPPLPPVPPPPPPPPPVTSKSGDCRTTRKQHSGSKPRKQNRGENLENKPGRKPRKQTEVGQPR